MHRRDKISKLCERVKCCKKKSDQMGWVTPTAAVFREKKQTDEVIRTSTMKNYAIVCHQVNKSFGKVQAVRDVNVAINIGIGY